MQFALLTYLGVGYHTVCDVSYVGYIRHLNRIKATKNTCQIYGSTFSKNDNDANVRFWGALVCDPKKNRGQPKNTGQGEGRQS